MLANISSSKTNDTSNLQRLLVDHTALCSAVLQNVQEYL